MPVLFMSGAKDELVPEWMMRKLHEACPSPKKQFESFPTGEHVNTFTCRDYYPKLKRFLDEHLGPSVGVAPAAAFLE